MIKVNELTKNNFEAWGKFISADEQNNLQRYDGFNYVGNIAVAHINSPLSFSILEPLEREIVLVQMESHKETSEICVALENECLFFVAADKNGFPDEENIKAFLLKAGDTVIYNPSVWHWVPFATKNRSCKQLIIYKDQTGKNDFYAHKLSQPVRAEI